MLDCMYGLKEAPEFDSFDQVFDTIGFKPLLLDTDPVVADKALYCLINKYIDDIHSGFTAFSYLTGLIDYMAENVQLRVFADRITESCRTFHIVRQLSVVCGMNLHREGRTFERPPQ